MLLHQKVCRCCGEKFFKTLEVYPELSPFFMRYGLQITMAVESNARSLTLDKTGKMWPAFLPPIVSKITRALNYKLLTKLCLICPMDFVQVVVI